MSRLLRILLPSLGLLSGCELLRDGVFGDDSMGKACTDIGCVDGLFFDMALVTPGAWTVTLTADGTPYTCTGEVPFSGAEACDAPLSWGLSGTALPADDQYIDGLSYFGTASEVSVTVTLDGATVHEAVFTPTWVVSQPNGPGCGPTCTSASASLGSF